MCIDTLVYLMQSIEHRLTGGHSTVKRAYAPRLETLMTVIYCPIAILQRTGTYCIRVGQRGLAS
jgi:hypothetical protein